MIFSEQDVIKDPPFSRLDLISCRNLLIYLGPQLQKKLMPLFHYALNPDGILLLGTSETVGNFTDLFSPIDRKSKLYKRTKDVFGTHRKSGEMALFPLTPKAAICTNPVPQTQLEDKINLGELVEKNLLLHFSATGALVNEHGGILYLHGRTGKYLEPSPGEAGQNILKMSREGLRQDLTTALRKAATEKIPVSRTNVRVKTNGDFTNVNVSVRPVQTGDIAAAPSNALFFVIFEDSPAQEGETASTQKVGKVKSGTVRTDSKQIAALRQELRIKEEYLQTTVEELNSSNEEMQSVNEELQSANEELETSKEELQSVNEELSTVNMELQTKVTDLTRASNDMNNLFAGTGIGTIFVDNQLCIRRFTPAVTAIVNLIASDVGRPVNHIVSNLVGYDHLMDDVQTVLDTLIPKEDTVSTKTGGQYLLRIQPYRTIENVIEGVVIMFVDVSKKTTSPPAPLRI